MKNILQKIFLSRDNRDQLHSFGEAANTIMQRLQGCGDNTDTANELLLRCNIKEKTRNAEDLLDYLNEIHPAPHWVNYLLFEEEFRHRKSELLCYPSNVWMDLSSMCSVECRFCKYTRRFLPKENVSLETVKSIEWLKHVRLLNLSAGTGEALCNPQFMEIFDYIRDSFPHLHITMLTNGKLLTPAISKQLVGRIDNLHVSMNASNEHDYNRVFVNGDWRRFLQNLDVLKGLQSQNHRTRLTASFVMMDWNIERAVENLEFAAEHGAELVLFHHYYTPYVKDVLKNNPDALCEKFPTTESLYYNREKSDMVFDRVRNRASELGVSVQTPVPFGEKNSYINYGMRSSDVPSTTCNAPWLNMYLLWGFKSKRTETTLCCGLASDIGTYFSWSEITSLQGIRALWNHEIMQAYRKSANPPNENYICRLCRRIDRFDPESIYPDQRLFFESVGLTAPDHLE